jgi:hypothetical protein
MKLELRHFYFMMSTCLGIVVFLNFINLIKIWNYTDPVVLTSYIFGAIIFNIILICLFMFMYFTTPKPIPMIENKELENILDKYMKGGKD